MSEPRNQTPDTIDVAEPLASIIALYAHTDQGIPSLGLAAVESVRGLESRAGTGARGAITIADSGEAVVSLDGFFTEAEDAFAEGAHARLVDGSTLTARHAHVTNQRTSIVANPPSRRTTTDVELSEWHWSSAGEPVAWVGALRGARVRRAYNLSISGHGRRSLNSLRLEGNAIWHFIRSDRSRAPSCLVVVDARGAPPERAKLWNDFAALEFLFGTPLRLELLVGVDASNQPVAAYGASFGYRFNHEANHAPPVPEDRDHTWAALAFPLVARALSDAGPEPTTAATCGYVDSTIGHIDGQYLFAQVALEALANRLSPSKLPLVGSESEWKAWVKSTREVWAAHARDHSTLGDMYTKLRDVARPTTSSLVRDWFSTRGLAVPEDALRELRGRNIVAHTGSMNKEGEDYEIERDVRRVRIVRALLAGMLLRNLGYEGALNGWDLDDQGWPRPAEWFGTSERVLEAARQVYVAGDVAELT